jgi:acyl-CoA-binding protein
MNLTKILAKQTREVLIDGTWISTNLKTQISDLTWEEAITKVGSLNTIAALTFHLNYYVAGVNQVFAGGTLDIRDKYSFDMPPITSKEDWEKLRNKTIADAEKFVSYVEALNDKKLAEGFVDEKYGTYYRNIVGMVEHCYYHLGQIVIIKKLIREGF